MQTKFLIGLIFFQIKNGLHFNMSLWDEEGTRNLLYNAESADQLTDIGRQWLGMDVNCYTI